MAQVWKTVRVFISSTFRDMHAERDYLVRFVFPELRERCAKRRLHLVDVDLRWGVTEEEAEQGKVLEVCLDEIERCRPFFVGLLGERYGWVPPGYDVPEEPQYDWVLQFEAGHSVTALEIYHGVLRNAAMQRRAFFYFRNPAFISDIPEPHRADFLQENDEARAKLYRLRSEIRQRCTVRENYGCGYGGVDRDGRVLLTGLEPFGRQVLEDLWSSIDAENPGDERTTDPLAVERAYHDAFIEARSQQFIGRQDLLAHLAEYADGEEAMPLIVTGAPGCGKSALLASFAKQYTASHPDTFVLAHFIGVSPGSTDVRRTLLRLCRELSQRFDLGEEILEHYHELRKILPVIIDRSCSQSRIVLILDGLNQLDASYVAHELLWLPRTVPPGLRLIVSTLEGDCLDALGRRVPRARELEVGPLLDDERKEIVTLGLGTYRKQVDAYQMEQLLAKRESASPLYLMVACEELRVFGEFERVTELITNLPDEVEGLLQQVIERFERDHGTELVESALSLLECSRHGLLESEMLELLRRNGEDRLPLAIWSRLYRSLQFYLRPPDESGEGALNFFHRQLSKAVKRRYLESDDRRVAAHRRLARLFASKANTRNDGQWAGNYPRSLSELPYHLLEGRMYEELFQTARDERFLIEQGRAFPDEPDAALRTIQLAIEGASRKDDAAAMAEFVLAHTRSLAESAEQSPLDALRAGNIERAWKVADMLDAERCALWYLLLAWELCEGNRIEEAQATLARLNQKELPYLSVSMEQRGVGLLCQLTKLDEDTCERLWTRLLNEFGRRVLCGRLIEANQRAAAFRVANGIESQSERARLLVEVAQAQAKEAEFSAAEDTAGCIDVANDRAAALSAIAVCLAGRGDLDGARRTADQIENPGSLVRARVAIARAEGDLGLEQEAQASIAAAEQSARGIRDAGLRALGFCNIAVIQADRGELAQARDLFSAALETARSGQDRPTHQLVLTRIAEALVEAGEAQSAVDVALESDRLSREALSRLGGKAQKTLESGKYWTSALQRLATALAKRGDFAFALQAAENLEPDWVRVAVLAKIGVEQATHGDAAGAQATFQMATEAAAELPDALRRASAFNAISLSQSRADEGSAARQSFATAMREVQASGDSSNQRQIEETLTQIVGAQAEAGQTALAVEAAEQIAEPRDRVSVLVGVARARFRAGAPEDARMCFEAAEKAARSIADEESRASALLDIAAAEEDPGKQLTEADNLRIALQVPHRVDFSYWRDEAMTAIVTAQAGIGDVNGALRTLERVGKASDWRSDQAWAAIAVAEAKSGDAQAALQAASRINSTDRQAFAYGFSWGSVLVAVAQVQAEANALEAAGQVLELASQLAKSDEDPYSLCGIAERQVKIGEVEAARRSLTTALSVARNDEATLKAIAIGQAKAGAINAALMLVGRISHTEHRANALAGIAVVQAQASVPEAALQTALRIPVSDRTKALCDIALAQAKQGEAQLALSSLEAALRNADCIEDAGARTKPLLEVAAAQTAMGETEAAVATLTAAAQAAGASDDVWLRAYYLRGVAVAQAEAGDARGALDTVRRLQQDEEISPISDRAFFLNQALQALCEAQATAGDTQAALRSARGLTEWHEQLHAIVGIAVVRAKAGDTQPTRECFDAALEIVPPDLAGGDRDSALRRLAVAQAEAGESLSSHEFFDLSLENARRIESPKDRADALRRLAEAQANTGETDAARETFSAALESARRIEYYSRANPLGEIAVAQARAGDVPAAVESVLGSDISEDSRAKILCEIALHAAEAHAGEQALKVADAILTERNRRLPELAARFADANDRQHFKRLLIPCAYYTDAAYLMCGLLAKLYPQESTGLAEVLVRAINAQQTQRP